MEKFFLLEIIFDFSKNNSDKNYAAYQALTQIKRKFFNVQKNKQNSDYLKKVLNKLYDCKYISKKNKNTLKEKYKTIKFYNDTKPN